MLALVGCARQNEDITTPTGYPSGTIQQPQIMYDGQVYFYFATGFEEPLPDGYELVGSITGVDNENEPAEAFHGASVNLGQEVYASESDSDRVYVKYEKGHARFSVKTETIRFQDQIFSKSDLSEDTLKWLEWYNGLTETEQLAISYIPADLYELCGYRAAENAIVIERELP